MKKFIAGFLTALSIVAFYNYCDNHPTYSGVVTYVEDGYCLVETESGDLFGVDTEKNYHIYDRVEICMDLNGTDTQSDDVVKSIHLV